MSTTAKQPDADLVRQFLLGQLSEPQHAEVEQKLAVSSEWLSVAEAAVAQDGLIETLRALGDVKETPLPPVVEDLMVRLGKLQTPSPHTASADAWATAVSSGPTGPRLVPPYEYPFLAPPRQSGELGWLGGYRVLRQLGAGGMGIVFAGEDPALKRRVALKVMRTRVAADPEARQRFLREAQAAAAIDHTNVVPIYHVGETPVPFIAMPLLTGESLEDRLKQLPLLPIEDVVRIGIETAQGLAAAHAAGLIHRDIKPANLWLAPSVGQDGLPSSAAGPSSAAARFHVKILDFGLARPISGDNNLTRVDAVLGTPAYMSPEQANGQPVDARCDLFSLGCVLYQMASGKMAFEGSTLTALLRAVAEHHPAAPHKIRRTVPRALSELIMELLNKEPAKRPQSAQDVATRLRALGAEAVAAPSGLSQTAVLRTKRLVLAAAGVLTACILVIGLFFAFRHDNDKIPSNNGPAPINNPERAISKYRGSVDILVWRTAANGLAQKLRLNDPGALPLVPGDRIRVTAHIEPAGYVYLFWIDEEGKAAPIYPWNPGDWGTRPPQEAVVGALDLPEQGDKGFTIDPGPEGMESLIMLAMDTPLKASDEDLKTRLSGLPPQSPVQNALAAVWFEDGKVVENDPSRQRAGFKLTDINDPVLRLQDRLKLRLQPLAAYSRAVSFARQAKK